MTLEIERLALTLPPALGRRAPAITRLLAAELAEALAADPAQLSRAQAGHIERIDRVDAGVLRVDARDPDARVARTIAAAIGRALAAAGAGNPVGSEDAACSPR